MADLDRADSPCLLGIDTGGTFTDFVLLRDGELTIHKVLSTPEAPEQAILAGIGDLGLPADRLAIVHGTTVATNAVLEGKGARTVFITNRGLGDLLTIGRQTRTAIYALEPRAEPPPLPADLCLEADCRLGADGTVVSELTPETLAKLRGAIEALAPDAVAVCLLFSFIDDRHERAITDALPGTIFTCRSSEVLPEYGEYERAMATWLNARVGPLVAGYLDRLTTALPSTPISIMQSSARTIAADQAARQGVHLLLSGPAGGLAGARFIAEDDPPRLLSFDMGGTSTDVAVIDGVIQLTHEGRIGPYPLAVPMVDIHTVGAGGGSLATIDEGGLLQVGPQSAGARPGPACYGLGGRQATVTDANLVLGRLSPKAFLGGRMRLDRRAAETAIDALARPLGLDRMATAEGIVAIANEHMAQALRKIAADRGIDPRDFTLTTFGGAGGMHACALAENLGIHRILVPRHAGVLSALGMLVSRRGRELSQTVARLLDTTDPAWLMAGFKALEARGRTALAAEGVDPTAMTVAWRADLRYRGQSSALEVPVARDLDETASLADSFSAAHARLHGHSLDLPVELVTLRVTVGSAPADFTLPTLSRRSSARPGVRETSSSIARDAIAAGQMIAGPMIVTEAVSTTYIATGWQAYCDDHGHLWIGPAKDAAN